MKIGERIRKIREIKGHKQEYMAKCLGISITAYSNIERDETDISWSRIETIAAVLEISPIQLLSFEDSYVFNQWQNQNAYGIVHEQHTDSISNALLLKMFEQQAKMVEIMDKIIGRL